jgi:hypothetical protein
VEDIKQSRQLEAGTNEAAQVAAPARRVLQLDPELRISLPELAALDVLNRMANVVMTKSQAHSWACKAAGLDTDAWSKEMAGSSSLNKRVSQAMRSAKITLQKSS